MSPKGQNLSSDHILLSPSAATLPELISHAAEQNLTRRGAREVTGQRKDDFMFPLNVCVSEYEVDGMRHFAGIAMPHGGRLNIGMPHIGANYGCCGETTGANQLARMAEEHAGTLLLSLIPVLTILVPLIRTVPGIYNWVARRQILYWYRRLQVIERQLDIEAKGEHPHIAMPEIDMIDAAASKIRVPLNYSDQYYELLSHIDLVRQRLAARSALTNV